MMDKRDVYRSNLNLLTNLCIILSTPSIEDIGEGFQEYDNFEFCSDALIKVIEHVNETAYIERSIYSQLKVVAKKAYDLCLPIVTQYMKEKEYMLLRQNNKLALMQHSSKADIDNHIDLGRAVFHSGLGLKRLALGVHGTQREADHAADRHAARHILRRLLDIAGVDADGCAMVGDGLIAQGLYLGPGGLRLEQGMVNLAQHFFLCVFHRKFSPFSQCLHRRA